jgi:hypothetical protein
MPPPWSAFRPEPVDVASILAALHRVEARFGRERQQRWGGGRWTSTCWRRAIRSCPIPATQDRWRNLPPEAQAREVPDRPDPAASAACRIAPSCWCPGRGGARLACIPGWVDGARQMLAALPARIAMP